MNIATELRRLGWKQDQIDRAVDQRTGKPVKEVDAEKKQDDIYRYKSKWEHLYSLLLEEEKKAGLIVEWFYEAVTLRLTDGARVEGKKVRAIRYTPDFAVWYPDGTMKMIEIKGYRRTKDINRFKVAKDRFRQIEFVMLKYDKGTWVRMPY
jgi:hypothetical protein